MGAPNIQHCLCQLAAGQPMSPSIEEYINKMIQVFFRVLMQLKSIKLFVHKAMWNDFNSNYEKQDMYNYKTFTQKLTLYIVKGYADNKLQCLWDGEKNNRKLQKKRKIMIADDSMP